MNGLDFLPVYCMTKRFVSASVSDESQAIRYDLNVTINPNTYTKVCEMTPVLSGEITYKLQSDRPVGFNDARVMEDGVEVTDRVQASLSVKAGHKYEFYAKLPAGEDDTYQVTHILFGCSIEEIPNMYLGFDEA